MRIVRLLAVLTVCFIGGGFEIASAQQIGALPVDSILRDHSFGELSSFEFSPDGKWLAYVVKDNGRTTAGDLAAWIRTGVPMWVSGCDIWISNIETGTTRNVTQAKGENWLPKWSPDGQYLAFLSDRDGGRQAKLWVWDAQKNELRKLSETLVRAEQIEWTPDARNILVTTLPEGMSLQDYITTVEGGGSNQTSVASKAQGSTVALYESAAIRESDKDGLPPNAWNLNSHLRDLSVVDVATGKTSTVIQEQRIETCKLSPDGSSVACTISKHFEKPGSQQILFDLWTFNLSTGRSQTIASDIRLAYDGAEFTWSPDSTLVSYHTGWTTVNDCYVVKASGGTSRNVTSFAPVQSERYRLSVPLWDGNGHVYLLRDGALWMASPEQSEAVRLTDIPGRRILTIVSQSDNRLWTTDHGGSALVLAHDDIGKQDGFYKVNLATGGSTRLIERGQCYVCGNLARSFAVVANGQRIAYVAEDGQHEPDLWHSDISFRNPRRVTSLNPQFDEYRLGAARLIDWLSDDGERLRGALLLPSDYQEGKRYPLIVWVYGGGVLSDNFDHFGLGYGGPLNFQLLATRGYAVLLPDSPQHEPTPMADLVKTVLPGVNKVVDMGIADPQHLALMGLSNGGYSTLALVVQTKRFACAIEMDGMGDLIADYGAMGSAGTALATSILEHGQDAMGGPPWQFPQRYVDNSPVFYLDRVETPLLMVQGTKDATVPAFLGDEIFVGLRRLGKEVEYAKYEGEDHSPLYWSCANQVDLCNRIIAWFHKYLTAKSGPDIGTSN
jgi:dipeptidyl aminopeptidase/acylaminoacyl peptidase